MTGDVERKIVQICKSTHSVNVQYNFQHLINN